MSPISSFMGIPIVEAVLIDANRWRDMMKLIGSIPNMRMGKKW
jgi:hypothetical protein